MFKQTNYSLIYLCCIFFFGSILTIQAQDSNPEPMVTDRPDATEAPLTVPKGSLQVETGAYFQSFEEDNIKVQNVGYNTTLLRYGVFDNFELRLGANYEGLRVFIDDEEQDIDANSFSPLLAGFKVEIVDEDGLLPQIGLLTHLYLPFSVSEEFRPETTGVDFRFSFAHTLSEKSSLSYNLGAIWAGDSPEAAYIYTLSYGYSITDKFGAYAELYGDLPEDSKANHLWDAGLTYAIKNNIQLDATVGSSFTKGQDILISTGISFRLPR